MLDSKYDIKRTEMFGYPGFRRLDHVSESKNLRGVNNVASL